MSNNFNGENQTTFMSMDNQDKITFNKSTLMSFNS